jgi:hypothetical protein
MPIIAPWLRPADVLGAMSSGGSLGLQRRAANQRDAEMAQRMQLAQMQAAQEQASAAERLRYNYDSLGQARELAVADDMARKEHQQAVAQQSAAKLLQEKAEMDALSAYRANQTRVDEGKLALDREKAYMPREHWNNETGQVDQFDPRTNAVNVLRPGGPMANMKLTAGTRAKMEQQEASALGSYDVAKRLAEKLDAPGPVAGLGGLARRTVNDAIGMVGLDGSNPSDEAVILARQFNAKMIQGLKSDSNINKDERKELMDGLPDPSSIFQGAGKVRSRMAEYLQTSLNSVRANAAERGSEIPLPFMTKEEVMESFKAGKITKEDVVKYKSDNILDFFDRMMQKIP